MALVNDSNYWEQRYQEGTTRWDLRKAAPAFESLLSSATLALLPGRTAVLGCGRGYDALLFAAYGFEVIGFDFADSAVSDARALAQSTRSSAQFLQQDIFDLPDQFSNYFDYVVEHTCFCAIDPSQRPAYVQLVSKILKPQGRILGIFFTHSRPGGPPFGIAPAEIRQYFETDFEILSLLPVTNSVPERQGEEHFGHFQSKQHI